MWIDKNVKDFPIVGDNDEEDYNDFLAAWIYDGEIESIEWYTYTGDGEFWNQNSMNRNIFDENSPVPFKRGPTHWMPVPRKMA